MLTIKMADKEEKEVVVMRIDKSIRDRLDKLAEKRKATLTSLTNDALERFLDAEECTFQDLLEIIETIPSLRVSVNKITQEMKGCPPFICKQMIEIIKGKQVFLYEESFDSIEKRMKELDKKNLDGIFMHLTIKGDQINKINETLKKVTEILKGNEIRIGVGAKGNDHEKILLFAAYGKKECEKDGKN